MAVSMNAGLQELVRDARRRKGLTQAQVAEAIDCKQSAVSMYENGRADAISKDKISSLAKFLDIDPSRATKEEPKTAGALRYCPDPECPSSVPYMVGGRVAVLPAMVPVPGDATAYCRYCGEVLASSCPNAKCRACPDHGAFCPSCGTAYIEPVPPSKPLDAWVRERQESSERIIKLTGAFKGDHT